MHLEDKLYDVDIKSSSLKEIVHYLNQIQQDFEVILRKKGDMVFPMIYIHDSIYDGLKYEYYGYSYINENIYLDREILLIRGNEEHRVMVEESFVRTDRLTQQKTLHLKMTSTEDFVTQSDFYRVRPLTKVGEKSLFML